MSKPSVKSILVVLCVTIPLVTALDWVQTIDASESAIEASPDYDFEIDGYAYSGVIADEAQRIAVVNSILGTSIRYENGTILNEQLVGGNWASLVDSNVKVGDPYGTVDYLLADGTVVAGNLVSCSSDGYLVDPILAQIVVWDDDIKRKKSKSVTALWVWGSERGRCDIEVECKTDGAGNIFCDHSCDDYMSLGSSECVTKVHKSTPLCCTVEYACALKTPVASVEITYKGKGLGFTLKTGGLGSTVNSQGAMTDCCPACQAKVGCDDHPTKSYCNLDTGRCDECLNNADCLNPEKPYCTLGGVCVECRSDSQCGDGLVCSKKQCRECKSDEHCPSNKCDTFTGTCAPYTGPPSPFTDNLKISGENINHAFEGRLQLVDIQPTMVDDTNMREIIDCLATPQVGLDAEGNILWGQLENEEWKEFVHSMVREGQQAARLTWVNERGEEGVTCAVEQVESSDPNEYWILDPVLTNIIWVPSDKRLSWVSHSAFWIWGGLRGRCTPAVHCALIGGGPVCLDSCKHWMKIGTSQCKTRTRSSSPFCCEIDYACSFATPFATVTITAVNPFPPGGYTFTSGGFGSTWRAAGQFRDCCPKGCEGNADCDQATKCKECDIPNGLCKECTKNKHCNSDPSKPLCKDGHCSECKFHGHCKDPSLSKCDRDSGSCVECLSHSHCEPGWSCNAEIHQCVQCVRKSGNGKHANCPDDSPFCDCDHQCTQCLHDRHCQSGEVCERGVCVPGGEDPIGCEFHRDCPAHLPKCSNNKPDEKGVCVECKSSNHCPDGQCLGGRCVECRKDVHCKDGQRCDAAINQCVECYKTAHCEHGYCDCNHCQVCLHDNHCNDGFICEDGDCVSAICYEDDHCPSGHSACNDQICESPAQESSDVTIPGGTEAPV